jgi:hypothetical protein
LGQGVEEVAGPREREGGGLVEGEKKMVFLFFFHPNEFKKDSKGFGMISIRELNGETEKEFK